MSYFTLLLPLLLLLIINSAHSSFNLCLYNREDVLPCLDYFNAGIISPGPNEYTIHTTRFQGNPVNGIPICVKRKEDEIVRKIQDLGSPSIKFLFSPGAEQEPRMNYTNQILVEYNVQCKPGDTAFIKFDSLDLESENCHDGIQFRCRDYVTIDAGAGGSMEYCGNVVPPNPFIVGAGVFTLKFRSSISDSYPGFQIFVTCLSSAESEQSAKRTCNESDLVEKSSTVEVIDLTEESLRNRSGTNSLPMTLTSTEIRTIDNLAESLFTVALRNARRWATHWPPASYSKNGSLLFQQTGERVCGATSEDSIKSNNISKSSVKLILLTRGLKEPASLDSGATMEAVRNENACNPIVRSVARSYISVAKRVDPIQLKEAQKELEKEPCTV